MDISKVNDVAYAWASHERNESNKGKNVNQKGWVTKEQMRKDAAQKTLGIMIAVAALTLLANIFIKVFGKAIGAVMMVVLALGLPICFFIQENMGYNIKWLPLWIVAFALVLKIFTKMFGKKWGLLIGIPIVGIIALIAYLGDAPSNPPTSQSPEERIVAKHSAQTFAQQSTNAKEQSKHGEVTDTATKSISAERPVVTRHPAQTSAQQFADTKIQNKDDETTDEITEALNELVRQIESNTDPSSAALRIREIRRMFTRIRNGSDGMGRDYTAAYAYNKCLERARVLGWIVKDVEQGPKDNVGGKEVVNDAEASGEKAATYLKDVSEKLNNLLVQVKTTKSPTTPDSELDSRVEYLKTKFEQELRCTPFNKNSLSETKSVVDAAYQECAEHAYRMHWIKTEEELSIEKGAAACLDEATKKIEVLVSQIKANSSEPSYILNDRAEYVKQMFDREMRFPLRDRWNSIEEAKAHTDKAYQACVNHALRMNWIRGR